MLIGRHVMRLLGDDGLLLGIDPTYLFQVHWICGISKGTYAAAGAHFEKTLSD